jgi:type IV secretion system protein VirB8
MKKQSREALDAYYADAASWNRDRLQALRFSQRSAWWIAGAAVVVAVLEAAALIALTPLKTVEPYTLLVDRTTGYVQALKPLDPATVTPHSALTQSFLVQYVIAREGFDFATVNANYRKVELLSADSARSGYLRTMQASNPQSPLVTNPRGTQVEARVKSVSQIGKDAALVRFETRRIGPDGQSAIPEPWIAVVRYRYSREPMALEDRFVNPLGFQVVSYRKDQEALPVASESVATAAVAPTAAGTAASPGGNGTAAPSAAVFEASRR